ncbi:hypothetical protein [Agaribacter marinus]|uniref:Uncharacterized protein n=1 Tax=Agaribacter marinus TaxID=1431249 RepID=A0AA37WLG4_9ALTE|nr:hypothetical protein [Agaribacter marinus]GLR72035.1 hypothetical protein GCM10007852_29430 [Agaribacter marinus]
MPRVSLPVTLQLALKQHVAAADIDDDDELRMLMVKLGDLNEKIEAVKQKVRDNRLTKR